MFGQGGICKRDKTLDGLTAQENWCLFSYELCIYFDHFRYFFNISQLLMWQTLEKNNKKLSNICLFNDDRKKNTQNNCVVFVVSYGR